MSWNRIELFADFLVCLPVERLAAIDAWLCRFIRVTVSQLYGSTTVVMANYGLHWKWRSLTPCQRHPSEPIEKIFGTIDYVIDLNNLAKFGFGKISRDWGTYTQHIKVCAFFFFFLNFLRSLTRVQPKRLNRFWCAISQTTPFGERRCIFYDRKKSQLDLDL